MKKVKFTLGLMLSFLFMGAGVSVNATDYILIGHGSGLADSITVSAGLGSPKDTVLRSTAPSAKDTICILDENKNFVPITMLEIDSEKLSQFGLDTILNGFRDKKDLEFFEFGKDTVVKNLDLSGFKKLVTLNNVSETKLETINLSGCSALMALNCSNNDSLKTLNLKDCSALDNLDCSNDTISSLNLTGCSELTSLSCYKNNLSSLDLTGLSKLQTLYCDSNNIESLDLIGLSELQMLTCAGNRINFLDLTDTKVLISEGEQAKFLQQPDFDINIKASPYNVDIAPVEKTAEHGALTVTIDKEHKFDIDWEIVDTTTGNILSSKGNEKDQLAIEVVGQAKESTVIEFSIRSNFTYEIESITVLGGINFHAAGDTHLEPKYIPDGSHKAGGYYTFEMPRGDVKITLKVKGENVQPDPTVNRTVEIQTDYETSPKATAGLHYVEGHKDFTFTVYSEDSIEVTTNRNDVVGDGILLTKNDNGTWTVTIRKVSTNLVIKVKKSTTSNDFVGKGAVWAANGTLYVKSVAAGVVSIYNVTGQLCKQAPISGDATFTLSKGIYIVQLNGKAYKVVL